MNVYDPSVFTITVPTFGISTILPAGYVTPPIVNCVIDNVLDSTSVSFESRLPERSVFSGVVTVSFVITGASFTGVTVKLKFAVFVAVPSETVYVIVGTTPLKLAKGVNVISPVVNAVIVPLPGIVAVDVKVPEMPSIVNCVIVKVVLPSGSESLVNTFTVTGVSSGVVLLSSLTAIGLSFVGVTVITKSPLSVPPLPSLTV